MTARSRIALAAVELVCRTVLSGKKGGLLRRVAPGSYLGQRDVASSSAPLFRLSLETTNGDIASGAPITGLDMIGAAIETPVAPSGARRPDIDGLRAFAVVPLILVLAGIPVYPGLRAGSSVSTSFSLHPDPDRRDVTPRHGARAIIADKLLRATDAVNRPRAARRAGLLLASGVVADAAPYGGAARSSAAPTDDELPRHVDLALERSIADAARYSIAVKGIGLLGWDRMLLETRKIDVVITHFDQPIRSQ